MPRGTGKLSTVAYTDIEDSASTLSSARTSQIDYGPAKRRRTGLNSRYDRMIESVNAVLPYRNSTPAASRRRVKSSSTSSVSSHDLPKTPVDAYGKSYSGKLGKDFSVLKMKKSSPLLREGSDGYPESVAPANEPRSALPDWLANTFCSLESDHPLRGLLSPGKNIAQTSSSLTVEALRTSHEEQVFAFSPFEKQTTVPEVTLRPHPDSSLNFQANIPLGFPKDITQPDPEPEALALTDDVLPFSTPGFFAAGRKSIEELPVQETFQEPLIPVTQAIFPRGANTMHPPPSTSSYLRPYDRMKQAQFGRSLPPLGQDNVSPLDIQDNSTFISHISQPSRTPNFFATPGPTFACSRPVYFDSPTEDPSSSDSLDPESYELDLNAIDFRWKPFMRSNTLDGYANTAIDNISPSLLGYAIHNQTDDQVGWKSRLLVDLEGYVASDEEHPALRTCAENLNTKEFYLDDAPETQPSYSTISNPSPINHPIGRFGPGWRSQAINEGDAGPAIASSVFLSPLRDRPDPTFLYDVLQPHGDEDNVGLGKEHRVTTPGLPPSTPMNQTHIPPPSTPHKVRLTQLRVPELPFRKPSYKTSSALSWMVPIKTSKRAIMVNNEVNARPPQATGNSDDTIQSWSESK